MPQWQRLIADGDCHLFHAFEVPYLERMHLQGIDAAILERRRSEAEEAANNTVSEVSGAAEGNARLHPEAIPGEPVSAILARITRLAPHLTVVGKHELESPHLHSGPMGGVGFRIAYHAPTDVLVLSS